MDDKDESDLVMVSNESETDFNPKKWQGILLSFLAHLAKGTVSFCHHLASVVR
jgi:hypothetical protein